MRLKILVTGATGFIGRNFCEHIETLNAGHLLFKVNSQTSQADLDRYLHACDIVYNFAAVHRPLDTLDFQRINVDYLRYILNMLKAYNPRCPVVTMSSIQAGNSTPYGNSKLAAEQLIKDYGEITGSPVHVLRLTNCFGKYARPNGHSVVATFCYNISHNIKITVDNPSTIVRFCYVDDVINMLISYLSDNISTYTYIDENLVYPVTLGYLAENLYNFRNGVPVPECEFLKKLKTTYDWYVTC